MGLDLALRREIDLGLVRELRHPDVEMRPLYEDELVLVAAGSHRFGDRTTVGVHELEDPRCDFFVPFLGADFGARAARLLPAVPPATAAEGRGV